MPRINLSAVTQWITPAASSHGDQLPEHVMARLDISRRSALNLLRKLCAMQWLTAHGTPRQRQRQRLYRPGPLRQVVQRYALDGLQEDQPWRRDFAPFFALPQEVQRMAQHAFTELLNNAIDHSGGSEVTVSMRQTATQMQLLVSDNGCGVFGRIAKHFDIHEPRLAMLELSKGKLTSLPDRHSGHGLFFTSRLADVFDLHANGSAFQHRDWEAQRWRDGRPLPGTSKDSGTSIYLAIALDTPRSLAGLLSTHSADGQGCAFERTHVPLQLLCSAGVDLTSRADARRVVSRLHAFKAAQIDFSGIDCIGHGFADELFRVYANAHPDVALQPVGMAANVSQMLRGVVPGMACLAAA
jgi:anti-sigma regulatory factor (Ser/Thr protein kinase)